VDSSKKPYESAVQWFRELIIPGSCHMTFTIKIYKIKYFWVSYTSIHRNASFGQADVSCPPCENVSFLATLPGPKKKKILFTTYFSKIMLNRVQHAGNVAQCVGTLQTNLELCSPKKDLAKHHFQTSTNYLQSRL
jgi:hypothetical protein